jgi:hypothetical protein
MIVRLLHREGSKKKWRAQGGIEQLGFYAPTGLKPAPTTRQDHAHWTGLPVGHCRMLRSANLPTLFDSTFIRSLLSLALVLLNQSYFLEIYVPSRKTTTQPIHFLYILLTVLFICVCPTYQDFKPEVTQFEIIPTKLSNQRYYHNLKLLN